MKYFNFLIDTPVSFRATGKFESPSPDWTHYKRYTCDYELMVVTSGILYVAENDHQYVINQGECFLIPPFVDQYGYKSSECSFYWLHFSYKNVIEEVIIAPEDYTIEKNKIVLPSTFKIDDISKIIVMMKQLQDSVRTYHEKMLSDFMTTTILCELHNQFNLAQRKSPFKQLYYDILDYVQWYIHTGIKVSEIAEHFGYNEKYLSHLFSTISGIPLKQYMLSKNIETAKFILSDTNKTINEISSQLGFNDSHNFMKAFKKAVGLTPTEYRNAYSKRLLFYK